MKIKQIAKRFLLAAWPILIAGCQAVTPLSGNPPTARLEPSLTHEASIPPPSPAPPTISTKTLPQATVQPLDTILKEQDKYLGKQVTVEGIVEAEGQMPDIRFYLRGPGDERLEVSPWAPLEVMQPPQGKAKPKTMADYTGLHLRLTGILKKGGQGILLEVSSVEEEQP